MFSLVTACMNRDAHVRRNLPAWLRLPGLAEIVIVEWSNRTPLAELRDVDPRVRVVRVEGEPQWILSYAYNVGIATATQPVIVKCDADCCPSAAAVAESVPAPGFFFAGYWQSGIPVGKPSVNGQCSFTKEQWEVVNGYSEIIRTYGRDDEDFYDRLIAAGHERREIAPAELDFLAHTHEERTINQRPAAPGSTEHPFLTETAFKEIRNYFLAAALPWTKTMRRARFQTIEEADRLRVLRRDRATEIDIPDSVMAAARLKALRHFAARAAKLTEAAVGRLDERACLAILSARMKPRAAQAA